MMAYNNRYNDFPDKSVLILPDDTDTYNLYGVTIYGVPKSITFSDGTGIKFDQLSTDDIKFFQTIGITIEGNINKVGLSSGFAIGRVV